MAATNHIYVAEQATLTFRTPSASLTSNKLIVVDYVTLTFTNGANAGAADVQIWDPNGGVVAQLAVDLAADASETMHVEWASGLPVLAVSTDSAGGTPSTNFHSVLTGVSANVTTSTGSVVISGPTGCGVSGVIGYHYERYRRP